MSAPNSNSLLRNIRLRVAYDGTNYSGWQVQPDRITIQGCLEDAIFSLTKEKVSLFCAGRTDAGVHALGQVANFFTAANIPAQKWRAALQTRLPHDIVIMESDEVPLEFHATFSAVTKRYRYIILNQVVPDPFLGRYCWSINQSLDINEMQAAAEHLHGQHDFRSFESHWPNKATSVRTVKEISIRRTTRGELFGNPATPTPRDYFNDQELIVLEIEADGFLYNMVRTITGTLTYVGRGRWKPDRVKEILEAQDRKQAGGTAPACGLFMIKVNYLEHDPGYRDPR